MTRLLAGVLAVATAGLAPAAPLEFALLGGEQPTRIELRVEVDGKPVSAIWDETFARLFKFVDRNNDGTLDATECARLPAPLALRQAIGNGFTPPTGTAPALTAVDRNGDGKVTPDELAAFYRAAGIGNVLVGVGRLPGSAELTDALLKALDTNADGKVSEAEWKAAAEVLKPFDKNEDELIGAGELVPKLIYPGAAGTVLLTPPTSVPPVDVLAKLPVVLLPTDAQDTHWASELTRRNGKLTTADLLAWRKREAHARPVIQLGGKSDAPARFAVSAGTVQIVGWVAEGRSATAVAAARQELTERFEKPISDPADAPIGQRRASNVHWLTTIADRDGNGKVDATEFTAWLDLQAQIARGHVMLTLLDSNVGLFELLDANHDGALSVRELRGALERLREARSVVNDAFERAKLPHVLLAAVSAGYPQSLALDVQRGPAWFRAMDRNKDGDVSRKEFTGPADVFDKLDADKDGLLDANEAAKSANAK